MDNWSEPKINVGVKFSGFPLDLVLFFLHF